MHNSTICKNINTIGTPSLKALIAGKYQDGGKKCVDKKKEIKKNSVNVTKKTDKNKTKNCKKPIINTVRKQSIKKKIKHIK